MELESVGSQGFTVGGSVAVAWQLQVWKLESRMIVPRTHAVYAPSKQIWFGHRLFARPQMRVLEGKVCDVPFIHTRNGDLVCTHKGRIHAHMNM